MYNRLMLIGCILLGSAGQILLKRGASSITSTGSIVHKMLGVLVNVNTIVGFIVYGMSSLVWLILLSRTELSTAYPMLSVGYIIVPIVSIFMFGESITLSKVLAYAFIITGTVILGKSI